MALDILVSVLVLLVVGEFVLFGDADLGCRNVGTWDRYGEKLRLTLHLGEKVRWLGGWGYVDGSCVGL